MSDLIQADPELQNALQVLQNKLRTDKEYYYSWVSLLATTIHRTYVECLERTGQPVPPAGIYPYLAEGAQLFVKTHLLKDEHPRDKPDNTEKNNGATPQ